MALVAVALVLGGVMSLNLKPNGRTILLVACGVGILYELGVSVLLQSLINMEMTAAMNSFFESLVETLLADEADEAPDYQVAQTQVHVARPLLSPHVRPAVPVPANANLTASSLSYLASRSTRARTRPFRKRGCICSLSQTGYSAPAPIWPPWSRGSTN